MAILVDGKLVSDKEAKRLKNKKPTKSEKLKSLVGERCRWIVNLNLYEGKIEKDDGKIVLVKSINRNINEKGKPSKIREVEKRIIVTYKK